MFGNYTQAANDRCFKVLDEDIYRIWDTIEALSEDETAECWREKITAIANEYSFSSRFALMRILFSRAKGCSLSSAYSEEPFEIQGETQTYRFSKCTMEHAKELPAEELSQYTELLCEIAAAQTNADAENDRFLIVKALRDVDTAEAIAIEQAPEGSNKTELAKIRKESRTMLSRQDALLLGHSLQLSFEEISWFLLRVFDFEDGFRFHSSNDLIEAYTFLTNADNKKTEELKEKYALLSKDIKKKALADKQTDWTQNISESLPELTAKWSLRPDTAETCFLDWMCSQSAYLDLPSGTAASIYQQLAVYIYDLAENEIPTPEREDFIKEIKNICNGKSAYKAKMQETLYKDGIINDKACKKISGDILDKNKDLYTSAPDKSKAWRTVTSDENGLPRLIMAGRPDASRSRVQDLLSEKEQVEKGDMLHLLWFGFNLCWEEAPISNDMEDLQWNLADFTETAEMLLDAALLAPFYPPHIMEQSMMLSIVVSAEDDGVPASNYAVLCESLIKPRNRQKQE